MIIKEGMYVRTKKGIAKIESLDDLDNVAWTDQKGIFFGIKRPSGMLHFELDDDGYVLEIPSYKIIDLIEPGDYVNGCVVTRICIDKETGKKYLNMYGSISEWENEDIKSVVTKEQFERIKYEVK